MKKKTPINVSSWLIGGMVCLILYGIAITGLLVMMANQPPEVETVIKIEEIPTYSAYHRMEINQLVMDSWGDWGFDVLAFYAEETGDSSIARHIIIQALAYEVPLNIAFSLAKHESEYFPDAINGDKNKNGSVDYGIFQLNNRTFPNYTKKELLDPLTNCHLGVWYLKHRSREYDTWEEAIMAYNSGYAERMNYNSFKHMLRIMDYERDLDKRFNEWLIATTG